MPFNDITKRDWVIVPAYNCLDYTKDCIKSLQEQTLDLNIWVLNNGSSDSTSLWKPPQGVILTNHYPNFRSLSGLWNHALRTVFQTYQRRYAFIVNNDAVLRPDTLERLLEHSQNANREFVTAVSLDDQERVMAGEVDPDRTGERPHPDFSCFMITRSCYTKVGPFDEHFIPAYREDQDYHRRMTLAGVEAVCIDIPFLHRASATTKRNPEKSEQVAQLDQFRKEYYSHKWGGLWPSETHTIAFQGAQHQCPVCKVL